MPDVVEMMPKFALFISAVLPLPADAVKDLAFQIRAEVENSVFAVGSLSDGKPMLTVAISDNLVKENGLNAGQMVREAAKLIQGGGGGQPHFATAGGKNADGLQDAVTKLAELVK